MDLPTRATQHKGGGVMGKCLELRLHQTRLPGVAEGEAGEGRGSEPTVPGETVTTQEVCFHGPPTRSWK